MIGSESEDKVQPLNGAANSAPPSDGWRLAEMAGGTTSIAHPFRLN